MDADIMVLRSRRRYLLVRHAVKQLALEHAAGKRRLSSGEPRFTRVSEGFLERLQAKVRHLVLCEVERQPSKGRTIR
jgi:hypothetical protein